MSDVTLSDLEVVKEALVAIDEHCVEAELILPPEPKGVVLIAHGSGSDRFSPRNRYVAKVLREHGLGTLLVDTETADERHHAEDPAASTIDVFEMAARILCASDWLEREEIVSGLPIGYLGAGTGAGAILRAAAERQSIVRAIVARGARVELADNALEQIATPTLLVVGARDLAVVHHNREAIDRLSSSTKRLEIIPGARHLFEEPGTLATVAFHAATWFSQHLVHPAPEDPAISSRWPATAVVRDGA